jgi:hypothetical protein
MDPPSLSTMVIKNLGEHLCKVAPELMSDEALKATKAKKRVIKPNIKAPVGKSVAKQVSTKVSLNGVKRSKTKSEIPSSTKVPRVLLNKKAVKYKPVEMDFFNKFCEQLFYIPLFVWGPILKYFPQDLYVIKNVIWCFWMIFYYGDIYFDGRAPIRFSNSLCFIRNPDDLCYDEVFSVVEITRRLGNASWQFCSLPLLFSHTLFYQWIQQIE